MSPQNPLLLPLGIPDPDAITDRSNHLAVRTDCHTVYSTGVSQRQHTFAGLDVPDGECREQVQWEQVQLHERAGHQALSIWSEGNTREVNDVPLEGRNPLLAGLYIPHTDEVVVRRRKVATIGTKC